MPSTPAHISKARVQRRWMTSPEITLWQALRNRQIDNLKFRRKVPLHSFTVDFLCPASRLVVEVTGSGQHLKLLVDRDRRLQRLNYGVLRFSNLQIETDLPDVLRSISTTARLRL